MMLSFFILKKLKKLKKIKKLLTYGNAYYKIVYVHEYTNNGFWKMKDV